MKQEIHFIIPAWLQKMVDNNGWVIKQDRDFLKKQKAAEVKKKF